jgi:molybdopterin/thiamine biosynthesis adenylyltransferase
LDALQTLNPMVKVYADKDSLQQKNAEYFSDKNFDVVCMLSDDLQEIQRVDSLCRSNNVLFLSGFVFGLYGFMFVDFNSYQFIV